jgi:hypothetical protein
MEKEKHDEGYEDFWKVRVGFSYSSGKADEKPALY